MSKIKQVNDDVKRLAMERVAHIKIYQLHLMVQLIDLGMSRGAFRGPEASQIGALFDTLVAGINKSFEITEEEIKKVNELKLPSISDNVPMQAEMRRRHVTGEPDK